MESKITNPRHQRKNSLRRPRYDYRQPGRYFVTICTHEHEELFGQIENDQMQLSHFGKIVNNKWQQIIESAEHFSSPASVVMPNHFHAIVLITAPDTPEEAPAFYPGPIRRTQVDAQSLSAVIRTYKSVTTRVINRMRRTPHHALWQDNYHDHVIKDDSEFHAITTYIKNNPKHWREDSEFDYQA